MTQIRLIIGLAAALAWLASITGAFFYGRSAGIDHQKAVQAKAVAAAELKERTAAIAIDSVNGAAAAAQRDQSTIMRTIHAESIRVVEKPVYRSSCIDADGVQLLDRARAAANIDLASQSAGNAAGAAGDSPKP